ncbi:hypothetical protein GCM10025868_37240 [Angustibacter aerolatus]|uniref:Uncharacterized protein n=1 Tax=Angustibacter aerolatus TaxID=1162965 RepID=A0ABQ6JMX2_9ACTN|nr:hypothetical protein [Angustibacter aerolatus]GMA88474.1 hypothetical protein GCM10025868_37240 [Angustibacter aerolatus]
MTEVSVPLDWLQQGRCGPLCARHGVVTTHATKRTLLSPTPAWMYLLLLAGVVVFVVVVAATRRRETGRLPACERCRTERRTWVGGVLAAWALVVITFVVAVQRSSAGLATVAVVLAVLALLATAGGDLLRVRTEPVARCGAAGVGAAARGAPGVRGRGAQRPGARGRLRRSAGARRERAAGRAGLTLRASSIAGC